METKIIALSAGHGFHTSGKRCMKALDSGETREWVLNDRIMDLVEERMKEYNCKVLRVDDTTGEKDIKRSTRVKAANKAKADIYLSMHHNAGINGGTGGGTVVFYYPQGDGLQTATQLYRAIVSKTELYGNRAVAVADGKHLEVINSTTMPAFLVENGFMDSRVDVPIILSQEHAEKTAQGIVNFLTDVLQLESREMDAAEQLDTNNTMDVLKTSEQYYPVCNKKHTSIVVALNSVGEDSSFANRRKIAKRNGINNYVGTAAQNIQMLNLLKAGLLLQQC